MAYNVRGGKTTFVLMTLIAVMLMMLALAGGIVAEFVIPAIVIIYLLNLIILFGSIYELRLLNPAVTGFKDRAPPFPC